MAESLGQLRQQARQILQYRDLELVRRDARIVAMNAFQAVDKLAGGLDAGESPADDDEMTESAPQLRIAFELDPRQPAQHRIADMHRIADRLEGQRMLGEAG